ncbi:DUF6970 domain-containing protein [Hymenobacter norwichensis]|uniref:DUF6970 domain-containing protein n=1 Tax=Hymenobacter norwichensis TaxID=223903 RepID=UPI000478BA31|nr:hypothetical protein [Hymenobacter norwichensis]
MKTLLFLLTCWVMLGLVQCQKDADVGPKQCSGLIQAKIEELQRKPKQNPAARIYEYQYDGRTVYTISADCCDQFNTLYDECLNPICAPSGGITGRGDGKCPDFAAKATNERLVWLDPR